MAETIETIARQHLFKTEEDLSVDQAMSFVVMPPQWRGSESGSLDVHCDLMIFFITNHFPEDVNG